MGRYIILKIETDESGEFCQENKCIGYLYIDHCHCCVLERTNSDEEPVLLESANNKRLKRTDACRAAEIEIDERLIKKAISIKDELIPSGEPTLRAKLARAYLAIAKAAGRKEL
jgi:hypothetical protein